MNPAPLRNWIEAGSNPSSPESTAESAEVRRLKWENAELRRANEILKTALALSQRRSSTADLPDRPSTSTSTRGDSGSSRSAAFEVAEDAAAVPALCRMGATGVENFLNVSGSPGVDVVQREGHRLSSVGSPSVGMKVNIASLDDSWST